MLFHLFDGLATVTGKLSYLTRDRNEAAYTITEDDDVDTRFDEIDAHHEAFAKTLRGRVHWFFSDLTATFVTLSLRFE